MKFLSIITAAILMGTVAASPARSEVFLEGSTDGCFGTNCVGSSPVTVGRLTFTDNSFGNNTVNDQLLVSSFGHFTLQTGGFQTYNTSFSLFIDFDAPSDLSPDTGHIVAAITGQTTSGNNGSVNINFDNTPEIFTFSGGTISLLLNDVNVGPGDSANISGLFTVTAANVTAAVPEPSTWAMMVLGFAGVGFMAYRRKQGSLQLA